MTVPRPEFLQGVPIQLHRLRQTPIERFRCGASTFNTKDRCGGNAARKFKRSDFGMTNAILPVGDGFA